MPRRGRGPSLVRGPRRGRTRPIPSLLSRRTELGRAAVSFSEGPGPVHRSGAGSLRTLLAGYTGIAAPGTAVRRGKERKAASLVGRTPRTGLVFNLSCSAERGALCLCPGPRGRAWTSNGAPRSSRTRARSPGRFFSPAERSCLSGSAGRTSDGRHSFATGRAKEAFVKATGEGLSRRPRHVRRRACSGRRSLFHRERGCLLSEWSLRTCVPCAGYAAAVVLTRRNFSIRAFTVLDGPSARPDPWSLHSSDHLIFPCSHARRRWG